MRRTMERRKPSAVTVMTTAFPSRTTAISTDRPRCRRHLRLGDRERAEVVLADEHLRRLVHPRRVELLRDVRVRLAREDVRDVGVPDAVVVRLRLRPEAAVEVVRDGSTAVSADVMRQEVVDAEDQPARRGSRKARPHARAARPRARPQSVRPAPSMLTGA